MKSIVILGVSGVGKTYALKEVFNIDNNSALNSVKTGSNANTRVYNGYQYLPELTGNIKKLIDPKQLRWFLTNGYITITDINPKYKTVLVPELERHTDIEYLVLTATNDEIKDRLNVRQSSRHAKRSKEETLADSIKEQNKLLQTDYKKFNQEELIEYLNKLLNKPKQQKLF